MRKPTWDEKHQLLEHLIASKYRNEPSADETQDEMDYIDNTQICVFDKYITDGPGYSGRLMVVAWGGSPEFIEAFIWQREPLAGFEDKSWQYITDNNGWSKPKLSKLTLGEEI